MKNHNAASNDKRSQVQQPGRPASTVDVLEGHVDALIAQRLDHVRIIRRDGGVEAGIVVAVLAAHFHAR